MDDIKKLENKMVFYIENTKKVIIICGEDEKHYRKKIVCPFCQNKKIVDKFRDHCPLTGKYRGTAHQKCIIFVTQKKKHFYSTGIS